MDAFDADVLIYAAAPDHPLGERVRRVLRDGTTAPRVGSVLLLPEVLSKPSRDGREDQVDALLGVLALLDLRPLDLATASLAVGLAARYRLRAADAAHLATAVNAGCDRFITNNSRDFDGQEITEVEVVYPADLHGLA